VFKVNTKASLRPDDKVKQVCMSQFEKKDTSKVTRTPIDQV